MRCSPGSGEPSRPSSVTRSPGSRIRTATDAPQSGLSRPSRRSSSDRGCSSSAFRTSVSETVRVLGLGAGGHAKVLLDALAALGGHEVVGLLDSRRELWGTDVLGVPVLGDDAELSRQYDQGVSHAFIGLGGATDTRPRRRLYELARSYGFDVVSVVHPRAVVSPSARVGDGATVLAGAVVNADATL